MIFLCQLLFSGHNEGRENTAHHCLHMYAHASILYCSSLIMAKVTIPQLDWSTSGSIFRGRILH